MGIEFIKFVLCYCWDDGDKRRLPKKVMVRGVNAVPYWRDKICAYEIEKKVKRRIRYFKVYAEEMGFWYKGVPKLWGVYGSRSQLDGCTEIHAKIARECLENTQTTEMDGSVPSKRNFEESLIEAGLSIFTPEKKLSQLPCK